MDSLLITFSRHERSVSVELATAFAGPGERRGFSSATDPVQMLDPLPQLIYKEKPIWELSQQYQEWFRRLKPHQGGRVRHGSEELWKRLGEGANGTSDVLLTAAAPKDRDLLSLPWELLVDQGDLDLRSSLEHFATIRLLEKPTDARNLTAEDPLRVLLLRGSEQADEKPKSSEERHEVLKAWETLDPVVKERVREPTICMATPETLADDLAEVKPHLLWFSGHGKIAEAGRFEIFVAGRWMPVEELAAAVSKATEKTGHTPWIAAFWACEGARVGGQAFSDAAQGVPSVDAGAPGFPHLVQCMTGVGIEVVLGVQTRIRHDSVGVLSRTFFRSLAEGFGPARALAQARADLSARRPEKGGRGRRRSARGNVEWTSPVLWCNSEYIQALEWRRPLQEDEAILFNRLGQLSLESDPEGIEVLAEALAALPEGPPEQLPEGLLPAIKDAPIWIRCENVGNSSDLRARFLRLFEEFRRAGHNVLYIPYKKPWKQRLLEAVVDALERAERRFFPRPSGSEGVDAVASLLALLKPPHSTVEGWRELLARKELTIAIVASGPIPEADLELLPAEDPALASLIIIATQLPEKELVGWKYEELKREQDVQLPKPGFELEFIQALALLDLPLSEEALLSFAADFDLTADFNPEADPLFVRVGDRYALRAGAARAAIDLLDQGPPDARRAAHRACIAFLEPRRSPDLLFDAIQRLEHQVRHAFAAGESETGLKMAMKVLERLGRSGRYRELLAFLKEYRKEVRRKLSRYPSATLAAAKAQIEQGKPRAATDYLKALQQSPISALDQLNARILEAEATRNTPEAPSDREEDGARGPLEGAVEILEKALEEDLSAGLSGSEKARYKLARLVAWHDLARNLHYSRRHDVARAEAIFKRVLTECTDRRDQVYMRLKATTLRNLSDIYGRYTYGVVERDPQRARASLEEALGLARISARSLCADLHYQIAKYRYEEGNLGDAYNDLKKAIDLARETGKAVILALGKNKQFWWNVRDEAVFQLDRWEKIEQALAALPQHSWVVRAHVDSHVLAARALYLQRDMDRCGDLLRRARALLESKSVFKTRGDFRSRWVPVYAGLRVLSAVEDSADEAVVHEIDWDDDLLEARKATGADHVVDDPLTIWENLKIWEEVD